MFVLVVDTSLMNVSIAAVVDDLDTTVSSVQSAIALEALVSAAFILISSKLGDLFGRKRAYVLGLLGYATGAVAMTLAQDLTAIIVFWAIIGGLGASLLLPAMQSLIHGNFEGAAQVKTYALIGAAAAIAAAVGPLLGGFVTTYLSWRVGFLLEAVIIAVVLAQIGLVKDVAYTGARQVDAGGAVLSVIGMGGVVLGILVWQEGGDYVVLLIAIGALALWALARWLVGRHRDGKVTLLDPDLFRLPHFRVGITGQTLQNITLGGAMIALPIFLQIRLEYDALETGLSIAPLSLTMFAVAILAGRKAAGRRPAKLIRTGFALSTLGLALIIPIVPEADTGWYLLVPLVIAGAGLGLLVSQLNNYTLAPIDEQRISEAAGVNSASGSFGLSFGLAMAGGILLATLSLAFTNMTNASPVIPSTQQQQIAQTLEDDAQVISNTELDELLAEEPPEVREEVLSINIDATNLALQIALLVPILAGLLGLFNSFRMIAYRTSNPRPPSKRRLWADRAAAARNESSMGHRRPRRRQRRDDRGDAPGPAQGAGGQLLLGRRSRVGGVRRARGRVRDLRRLHHLPRLHDLRPVAQRRGVRGAHRDSAVRDRRVPAGRGARAPGRGARLLRTLGRPSGVADDGGRQRGRHDQPLVDRPLPDPEAREPDEPRRAIRVRQVARSDLGPRASPERPPARRGGHHPRHDLARALPDRGRGVRLHAVLRGQRRTGALPGDADGIGDHGDRAHAVGDRRPQQPVPRWHGADQAGRDGAVAADPEQRASRAEREGPTAV